MERQQRAEKSKDLKVYMHYVDVFLILRITSGFNRQWSLVMLSGQPITLKRKVKCEKISENQHL
jgi:hypothetical protein